MEGGGKGIEMEAGAYLHAVKFAKTSQCGEIQLLGSQEKTVHRKLFPVRRIQLESDCGQKTASTLSTTDGPAEQVVASYCASSS